MTEKAFNQEEYDKMYPIVYPIEKPLSDKIEELKKEIEKSYNFHRRHNKMTSKPKGVMAVSEAKKLTDKAILLSEEAQKLMDETLNDFCEDLVIKVLTNWKGQNEFIDYMNKLKKKHFNSPKRQELNKMEKKHFIKIATDNIKGIEDLFFENQERFEKFGCIISFDKESSKACAEEWTEEPDKKELKKYLEGLEEKSSSYSKQKQGRKKNERQRK